MPHAVVDRGSDHPTTPHPHTTLTRPRTRPEHGPTRPTRAGRRAQHRAELGTRSRPARRRTESATRRRHGPAGDANAVATTDEHVDDVAVDTTRVVTRKARGAAAWPLPPLTSYGSGSRSISLALAADHVRVDDERRSARRRSGGRVDRVCVTSAVMIHCCARPSGRRVREARLEDPSHAWPGATSAGSSVAHHR